MSCSEPFSISVAPTNSGTISAANTAPIPCENQRPQPAHAARNDQTMLSVTTHGRKSVSPSRPRTQRALSMDQPKVRPITISSPSDSQPSAGGAGTVMRGTLNNERETGCAGGMNGDGPLPLPPGPAGLVA